MLDYPLYSYIGEHFIIPVSLSIITDVLSRIYDDKYKSTNEKKKIKQIIRRSVEDALPRSISGNIISQLVDTIYCELPDYSIKIVEKSLRSRLKEWADVEYKINYAETSKNISFNIANRFYEEPTLRSIISVSALRNVLETVEFTKNEISILNKRFTDLQLTLDAVMKMCEKQVSVAENMSKNAFRITEEYQSYFSKELFLEKIQPDQRIACLKDVYIQNGYEVLDLYKTDIDTDLFGFVNEFVNGNILAKYYPTLYSTSSDILKLLFIKGQPGSGKSSLFYALAHYKTHFIDFFPGISFYFVRLIELYTTVDKTPSTHPLNDVFEYLSLSTPKEKSVIVLDGLDEICAMTKFDSGVYCENLVKDLCINTKIKVILTTRLNYVNISHKNNKNVFNIQLMPLSEDDLEKWTDAYFNIHPTLNDSKKLAKQNIDYLRKMKSEDNIRDIVAIPLLFYMIVASSINIQQIESIGQLYDKVFDEMQSRRYNESEFAYIQGHAFNTLLRDSLPRQIARAIATLMYKNNDLLISVNSNELKKSIDNLSKEHRLNKKGKEHLEKLFPITFYYKKSNDVVEFAHKSIMEFFAAEQLFYEFISCKEELLQYITAYMLDPVVSGEILSFFTYFWNSHKDRTEIIDHYAKTIKNEFKQITSSQNDISIAKARYSFETGYILFKIYWFFISEILKQNDFINDILKDDYYAIFLTKIFSVQISDVSSFFTNPSYAWRFSSIKNFGGLFICCSLSPGAIFDNVSFHNCSFAYSSISNVSFKNSELDGVTFQMCELTDVQFINGKSTSDCIFVNCETAGMIIFGKPKTDLLIMGLKENLNYVFDECRIMNISISNMNLNRIDFKDSQFFDKTPMVLENVILPWKIYAGLERRVCFEFRGEIIIDFMGYDLTDEMKRDMFTDEIRKGVNWTLMKTVRAEAIQKYTGVKMDQILAATDTMFSFLV